MRNKRNICAGTSVPKQCSTRRLEMLKEVFHLGTVFSRFCVWFSFLQTLRAHTAKRQVLRRTRFDVLAVLAREILLAGDAALHEAHVVIVQDSSDGVDEFFNVVKTAYAEGTRSRLYSSPSRKRRMNFSFSTRGSLKAFLFNATTSSSSTRSYSSWLESQPLQAPAQAKKSSAQPFALQSKF